MEKTEDPTTAYDSQALDVRAEIRCEVEKTEDPTTAPVLSTIALVSDLHGGSSQGLLRKEGITLGDEGVRLPSKAQLALGECWEDFCSKVNVHARGRRKVVVVNGDSMNGKPNNSVQVITDNMTIQRQITREALASLTDGAEQVYIVRGTAAHDGKMSADAEALAGEIGATPCPSGTKSWWEMLVDWDGVLFDITHHPAFTNKTPWMSGGPAVRQASERVMYYSGLKMRVPDLVFRADKHALHDSAGNVRSTRCIFQPAWQLMTEYGYKIGARIPDIGGIIIDTQPGGKFDVSIELYEPARPQIWIA